MHTFFAFVLTYVIGGLTFVPLILVLILLHAHLTFPHRPDSTAEAPPPANVDSLRQSADDDKALLSGHHALAKKFLSEHEKDVAEGYFAVCREYVPGGVNGKPPVRTTPAGDVVAGESPSVYQSMYRSLFERRQASAVLDAGKGSGSGGGGDNGGRAAARRARNVFYVVLRHGHLMLYDDAEQVEVRHVIALANYDVSIYNGGGHIPEGELWIKRNAIRLSRTVVSGDASVASLPFYLFSENCSDKEDFYFALLQNQERSGRDLQPPPRVENFEAKHIISLVQKLHSSEEQLQTRWLNAMVGRLFLAVYKTQEVEDLIRAKITKKIARVKKPGFLSGIQLKKISLGESAPLVTNPKLKDLTIDGSCCVEADIQYDGQFRLELAATVKIDLGTRFKAREVGLVLAVVVKKLEGHALVKVKPPPSNRLWIAFEKMPRLELSIEPIVSTRQITYGVILRAIESRIREVFTETLVLPQWDDTPFMDTTGYRFRGGIWAKEEGEIDKDVSTAVPDDDSGHEPEVIAGSLTASPTVLSTNSDKSMSTPSLINGSGASATSRKSHKQSRSELSDAASTTSVQRRPPSPTVARSKSFAATAAPILSKDSVTSDVRRSETPGRNTPKDATALMTELSNRSQPASPFESPMGSYTSRRQSLAGTKDSASISSASSIKSASEDLSSSQATITESSQSSEPQTLWSKSDLKSNPAEVAEGTRSQSKLHAVARGITPSEKKQQALFQAAAAAKTWGWNTLHRKGKSEGAPKTPEPAGTPEDPIGRGRPLPPPGIPLPPPAKRDSISSLSVPKRRPVPPPPLPQRGDSTGKPKPVPPPRARQNGSVSISRAEQPEDAVMVVAAPEEDDITLPEPEDADGYGDFMENVQLDDDGAGAEAEHPQRVEPASETSAGEATPQTARLLSASRPTSSKEAAVGDDDGLATWRSAEEEEARSKSVWMDGQGEQ